MSTRLGRQLAAVLVSVIALAIACSASEPGRTSIFVRAPTGTTEVSTRQPATEQSPATPIPASEGPPSTVVPIPSVLPTLQTHPPMTEEIYTSTPEPTTSPSQAPNPTVTPTQPTPAPSQTIAPVPASIPTPTPTLHPTSTPAPTPTATLTPTPPTTVAKLVIECIFFDGLVAVSEADEFVQILNQGDGAVNLDGWRLLDVSDGSPEFTFPSYELPPQSTVRVYTDEVHPEYGRFSFQRKSAVWSNSSPDTARLFNPDGVLVSEKTYPPGC